MSGAILGCIMAVISAAGYGGVVVLMALESACLPLPSEIIMPFAGYLVSTGRFNLAMVATAGALGCNLGSTIAYLIGARGGRPAVQRWGRFVLLGDEEIEKFDRFFGKFGSSAVFIGRLLPVVRTFISLPAGMANMPFLRFQIYTFVGSWPWCFLLAYIGLLLGRQWDSNPIFQAYFSRFQWAVIAALALGFGIYVYRRLRARRSRAEHPL
jgi:membrane protein DedA with SNARE-associated domain